MPIENKKGTSILVRIDNSTAANHQITKRKNTGKGVLISSTQFNDDMD
jgi:hypothetical protein